MKNNKILLVLFLDHELFSLHCTSVHNEVAEVDAFVEVGHRNRDLALQAVQILVQDFLAKQVVDGDGNRIGSRKFIIEMHDRRGRVGIGMTEVDHVLSNAHARLAETDDNADALLRGALFVGVILDNHITKNVCIIKGMERKLVGVDVARGHFFRFWADKDVGAKAHTPAERIHHAFKVLNNFFLNENPHRLLGVVPDIHVLDKLTETVFIVGAFNDLTFIKDSALPFEL